MAFTLGPIFGGAFNSAVAIGITVMHLAKVSHLWIYLVTNFGALALAAFTFLFINPDDK
jgi:aquaporin Z